MEKGPGFSDSGYAMARILWIHYLSKVRRPLLPHAVAVHIHPVMQGRKLAMLLQWVLCDASQWYAAAYRLTSLSTPSS